MTEAFRFALLGLGLGGMYALAALGLVVVYRGSGVINFAHGAIGMVGTYAFWELHDKRHWGFAPAAIVAVLGTALIGWLAYIIVIRPLQDASMLARLLGTLGILITLQSAVSLRYQQQLLLVGGSLPQSTIKVLGATLGLDRLWLFVIGTSLALILWAAYKLTRFGLATAAVSEDPIVAASLGYSPRRIAGANWAIGSALAGLAGILLAPITGLQVAQLTSLIIPVLAVAVMGNMISFPVTLAAGLVLGVVQSELTRYVKTPGASAAFPLVFVLVALAWRGAALPGRGFVQARLPRVGTGRRSFRGLVLGSGVLVLLGVVLPSAWIDGYTVTVVTAIILASLVVVIGYAGQLSLAQYTLAGLGAYVAGRLASTYGLPFPLVLVIGVLSAVPIGIAVGLPALRTRGVNLAIATLALSVAIESLLFDRSSLTGGVDGIAIKTPTFFGISMDTVTHPRNYAVLSGCMFVLVALAVLNLRRGQTGRRLLAIRANERGASALGISVVASKLYAFSVGAVIAALGGILLSFRRPAIIYSSFNSFTSVTLVGQAVIGGVGFALGPLVGGLLQLGGIATNVGNLLGTSLARYLPLIGGIALILTVVRNPDGVVPVTAGQIAAVLRRLPAWAARGRREVSVGTGPMTLDPPREVLAPSSPVPNEEVPSPRSRAITRNVHPQNEQYRAAPGTLEVRDLVVRFGGSTAVDHITLRVQPGEVLGVIGPNGAGKTTLIDAITGFVDPDSGSVLLNDRELLGTAAHRRTRLGLGRSFQSLELFEDLTSLENLVVASEARRRHHAWLSDFVRPRRPVLDEATQAVVATFGFERLLETEPMHLPYGYRRLLAIARAVAAAPSVLLLDEPAAGLSAVESRELGTVIRGLAEASGIAILLVEHDVEVVMATSDRILALNFGREIACGSPAEVRSNSAVIEAYLGRSDDEQAADEGSTQESQQPPAVSQPAVAKETPHLPARTVEAMLRAEGLYAGYNGVPVVHDVSLQVGTGEVVVLLGPNGAGKTTSLRSLSGALRPLGGTITWMGKPLTSPFYRRCRDGLGFVPEGRSVFQSLTTAENLKLGRGGIARALNLIPELEPLLNRRAGLLSGGEQQMVALARALASGANLLLADELSLGLAPLMVRRLLTAVRAAASEGVAVLLVEQHLRDALAIADRAYVISRGRIALSGSQTEMLSQVERIEATYLSGIGADVG